MFVGQSIGNRNLPCDNGSLLEESLKPTMNSADEDVVTIPSFPFAGTFSYRPERDLRLARFHLEKRKVLTFRISDENIGALDIPYARERDQPPHAQF